MKKNRTAAPKPMDAEYEMFLRQNAELRMLVDNAFEGLIVHENGIAQHVNKAFLELFKATREDCIGKSVLKFVAPESRELVRRHIDQAARATYVIIGRRLDGSEFIAEVRGKTMSSGQGRVRVSSIIDITERTQAFETHELLLKCHREVSRKLSASEVLLSLSKILSSEIMDVCVAAACVDPGPVLVVKSTKNQLPVIAQAPEKLELAFAGECAPFRNLPVLTKESIIKSVRATGPFRRNPDDMIYIPLKYRDHALGYLLFGGLKPMIGSIEHYFTHGISRCASHSLETSRLFRIGQESIHLRDEFLGMASHELKTPLTSLQLQVQLMKGMLDNRRLEGKAREGAYNLLALAEKDLYRLRKLVHGFLDVSSGKARLVKETAPVDLSTVVGEVKHDLKDELASCSSKVRWELVPGLIGSWNSDRIRQVVTNLIANALRYGRGRPIVVRTGRDQEMAVLEIHDHGIGISPELQARLFEKFQRGVSSKEYSGMGLGLFVSRRIVEEHHGTISVLSEPNHGSVFTVRLPLKAKSETTRLMRQAR